MLSGMQEGLMSDRWVLCTDHGGDPVYVNLGNALTMRRVSGVTGQTQYTVINFTIGTSADDRAAVQEAPDQILKLKTL
jgi:hypothetical protein